MQRVGHRSWGSEVRAKSGCRRRGGAGAFFSTRGDFVAVTEVARAFQRVATAVFRTGFTRWKARATGSGDCFNALSRDPDDRFKRRADWIRACYFFALDVRHRTPAHPRPT